MIDNLTIGIDKLWISALRGFDPNDIEFKGIGIIRRDTTRPLSEICKKTDSRTYLVVSDVKEVHLDHECLNGWSGKGHMNTLDGYDSKIYLAFRDGCLGNKSPKDPMELSFREAQELYGDMRISKEYEKRKETYDLGVKTVKNWPEFLKTNEP